MADSHRTRALKKVAEVLGTIAGVKLVTRTWRQYDSCNEFPVLIVTEAQSSGPFVRRVMDLFQDDYRITVYGYVLGTDAAPRIDVLENLYDTVIATLMANATLDGVVRDLRPDGPRASDGGLWEQRGVFVQDFILTFDETYPGP